MEKVNAKGDLESAEGLIYALYRIMLDRDPDSSGRRTFADMLDTGKISRQALVESFVQSDEFIQKHPALKMKTSVPEMNIFSGYDVADLTIFDHFIDPNIRPKPKPGFVTDFLGNRTRISSLWRGCEHLDNTVRPLPIPGDYQAGTVEWIGALEAVLAAKDRFAMMELGAGVGPWLVVGAAAAKRRAIHNIALYGVEADPGRFALMRQNLVDNDLMRHEVALIEAAVGNANGVVRWPKLVDPRNFAGGRPLRESNEDDAEYFKILGRIDEMEDIKV